MNRTVVAGHIVERRRLSCDGRSSASAAMAAPAGGGPADPPAADRVPHARRGPADGEAPDHVIADSAPLEKP